MKITGFTGEGIPEFRLAVFLAKVKGPPGVLVSQVGNEIIIRFLTLPVYPVEGQVIFEGRPAAEAWVVFHPKADNPNLPRPRAKVDQQGKFTLTTYEPQDGAPAGEYAVTLELRKVINKNAEGEIGPNLLPAAYSSPQTTKIVAKIAEGPNKVPITLTR